MLVVGEGGLEEVFYDIVCVGVPGVGEVDVGGLSGPGQLECCCSCVGVGMCVVWR